MSDGCRITIGVVCAIGAAPFFLLGLAAFLGPATPFQIVGFNVVGLFFLSVALACFWEASQPVTVRIVGGLLFLGGVAMLVQGIVRLNRGEDVPLEEVLRFPLVFGLPGLFVLLTAGYPRWGAHGGLFYQGREEDQLAP